MVIKSTAEVPDYSRYDDAMSLKPPDAFLQYRKVAAAPSLCISVMAPRRFVTSAAS